MLLVRNHDCKWRSETAWWWWWQVSILNSRSQDSLNKCYSRRVTVSVNFKKWATFCVCPRHCDIKTLLNCQFYLYNISNFQRTTKLGSFWWDIQNYFFGNERSTRYRFKYWEVIASTLYSIPIDYKWFIWLYDLFIFQGFYFDFFCRYQSIYSHPCSRIIY